MINYRVIFFFVILIGDLVSIAVQNKIAEYVFKPLIVIWLLAWFIMQARMFRSPLKKWIILGLFFSWAGDVLLMFQDDYPVFFLLGLSSFLVAHHLLYFVFSFCQDKGRCKRQVVFVADRGDVLCGYHIYSFSPPGRHETAGADLCA